MKRIIISLLGVAVLIAMGLAAVSPPPVSAAITAPTDGATVSGTVSVSEDSTHDTHRFQYKPESGSWWWDGVTFGGEGSSPRTVTWDTASMSDGNYQIRSQYGTWNGWYWGWTDIDTITVTVSNALPCEGCAADIVFLLDTSQSMGEEWGSLCDTLASVISDLSDEGFCVQPYIVAIGPYPAHTPPVMPPDPCAGYSLTWWDAGHGNTGYEYSCGRHQGAWENWAEAVLHFAAGPLGATWEIAPRG